MMPFSGAGDRVRPGPSRRAKELCLVIQKAIQPVIDLRDFPNSVVDVFIELPQTDAGSRCASICAASIALADAGITLKDMVAAVSVGRVADKVLVDLDYNEEAFEGGPVADIPVAIIPTTNEISLLQLDGDIDQVMLKEALAMAIKACHDIKAIQIQAIKEKYQKEF
jgi:exosome complex component RRP41